MNAPSAESMNAEPAQIAPALRQRMASVDTLRGLVITLMIFVNDAAGIERAPSWLRHVPASFDGMTLPDVVFPAFLFLAGMSIPLSFGGNTIEGKSRRASWWKILGRTFALLVMGVLMVNLEEHNPWFHGLWGVLTYTAMFAAFMVLPSRDSPHRPILAVARGIGCVALLLLALAYRTPNGEHLILGPLLSSQENIWLRHSWWGILGLIGWAYLVAAGVYLYLGRRREWLVGAVGLLILLPVATASSYGTRLASRAWLNGVKPFVDTGEFFLGWLNHHVSIGSNLGALASITTAGCCLGSLLTARSDLQAPHERLRWGAGFAAGLFIAALLLDGSYGINKIHATPAWCLLCAGLTSMAWLSLYWLMDVRQHRQLGRIVGPAGANPLLAYLLHPFLFMMADLLTLPLGFYRNAQWPVAFSLIGSFAMALFIGQLTGVISRAGYRLKV